MQRATFTSDETIDQEEPLIGKFTMPPFSSQVMENGREQPLLAGLRLVKEARRTTRNKKAKT